MNRFLIGVGLAVLITFPAVAQSWDPDIGSGNIAPAPYGQNLNGSSIYQHSRRGFRARAQAPRRRGARFHRHGARFHR